MRRLALVVLFVTGSGCGRAPTPGLAATEPQHAPDPSVLASTIGPRSASAEPAVGHGPEPEVLGVCEHLCGRAYDCVVARGRHASDASHLEVACLDRCLMGSESSRTALRACKARSECGSLLTCLDDGWDAAVPVPASSTPGDQQGELLVRWCEAASRCVDERRSPDPSTVEACVRVLSSDENVRALESWLTADVVDCYSETCLDSCLFGQTAG